jgi:2-iminobutanoate/2-iminopropanoate deaminase
MAELKRIHTEGAPAAIGPYSQAMVANGIVYTAGQIALDPQTMDIIGTTVAEQTERVFANLKAVLEAAGASLDRVVKTTCFLADMADFAAMNEVYAKHFGDHKPARSTVAAAGLPKNVRVEIECVAVL